MVELRRRIALIAVLTAAILALGTVALSSAGATGHEESDPCKYEDHPLFITEMVFTKDGADPDSVMGPQHNRTAFVHEGDNIDIRIKVKNRVFETCVSYDGFKTDDMQATVYYLPNAGDANDAISAGDAYTYTEDLGGDCSSIGREESCQTTLDLPVTWDNRPQILGPNLGPDGSSGEQRIIVLLEDTDENSNVAGDTTPARAAAERVIVVEQKPDLHPTGVHYDSINGDNLAVFELTVENNGAYPNWNPNGGSGFVQRSSFDGPDSGYAPDDEDRSATPILDTPSSSPPSAYPPCNWDTDGDGVRDNETNVDGEGSNLDPGEAVCSYRRGQILDMPVTWEMTRDGESTIVEDGVDKRTARYSNDADDNDKNSGEVIHPGENPNPSFSIPTFNPTQRAGSYDVRFLVDEWRLGSITPESNEDNNEITLTGHEIDGPDLKLSEHNVRIQVGAGIPAADCMPGGAEAPCPAGSTIEVYPRYKNVGDDPVDDETWRASVNVTVGTGDAAEELTFNENSCPNEPEPGCYVRKTDVPNADDEESFFGTQKPTVESKAEGGIHRVIIRLDHPVSYGDVSDEKGKIIEKTEDHDLGECNGPIDGADNAYCLELEFKDTSPPEISDLAVDPDRNDDEEEELSDKPKLQQGREATFFATVEDNALEPPVLANFTHLSGNVSKADLTMEKVSTGSNRYQVNTTFPEGLGDWLFKVKAKDNEHNVTTPDAESMEFSVTGSPKEIHIAPGIDELNNVTGPRGGNAPTYIGTADDAGNWFNITANITDTGHDEPDPIGKNVTVHDPDGNERFTLDMDSLTVCKWHAISAPGADTQSSTHFNNQCEEENVDAGQTRGEATWTWWYVNTTETAWEDDHPDVGMPWVGTFNVTVQANDTFGNTNSSDWMVEIQDRINDNGFKRANVTIEQAGPKSLAPGERFDVSALVKDALRVERVYLDIQHAAGDSWEANLTAPTNLLEDALTRNGTYTPKTADQFLAGTEGASFARAGSYDVDLVAVDFANNTNTTDLGTVSVSDTDDPEIVRFETQQGDSQEAGGNITWIAEIEDATEIQPPVLTITKPSSTSIEDTMTFDEEQGLWVYQIETAPADTGTWSYDLEVSDYANHVVTDAGQIDVDRNEPPQAINWGASPGTPSASDQATIYTTESPTLWVHLRDTQGVNASTIEMTVDGETVYGPDTKLADRTTIDLCEKCYNLSYTPSEPFEGGETITVQIRAEDVSNETGLSDWQPRSFKIDTTPPSVSIDAAPSLQRQGQQVIGGTSTIEVSTSDADAGPGPVRVTVKHLAGTVPETTKSKVFPEGEATFTLAEWSAAFRGHGTYLIEAVPEDAVGNEGDRAQERVLFDEVPPKIKLLRSFNKARSYITANITDLSNVQSAVVKFTANNGPQREIDLTQSGGTWNGRIVNPENGQAYPENTTVEFFVEATDFFGNTATSNKSSFEAGNAVPTISIDQPEANETLQGVVDVRWTASDAETSASELKVSLYYTQGDGKPREITGARDLRNVGQHQLDTTLLPNGDIELQAIVFDGSTFGSDTVNITVRNTGSAFTSPEVLGADTDGGSPVVGPGESTTFTVQINGNVRAAWANVTRDGEPVESLELEDSGGGTWRASFTTPAEEGEYAVDLAALTADGPQRSNDAYGFTVQSGEDGKSFVPEWTILSVLFAGAVAVGAFGLTRRWT